MNQDIKTYNNDQDPDTKAICQLLASEIQRGLALPEMTSKIWHGAPVWFLDGNPVAGYSVLKDSVQLLFWSGQSFDEPDLESEGTFKAAQARYTDVEQVDIADLQRWLDKSITIQWDYKNIVKRRGVLERLK